METINLAEVAELLNLSKEELLKEAIITFLQSKIDQTLRIQQEILVRYGASSLEDLEARITKGTVVEHPAWEDLIIAENLMEDFEELEAYLAKISPKFSASCYSLAA